MQWHRNDYLALMTFGPSPRPMFTELFGPLIGLEDEWRAQGATAEELSLHAFDWDYVPHGGCAAHTGPISRPSVTLEDNDEFRIERDFLGRTMKLCKKTATIPLPLDFPVKNMDDWRKLKPLFTFHESRIDWNKIEHDRQRQAEGEMVCAYIPGAFDMPRELMGEEVACMAYYDQPELMADIVQTISDTAFEVLQRVSERLLIDQLSVHEDFAGRSGPLVGPVQIKEYFQPYYRRIWEVLHSRGTRIFQQDTDGNVNSVIEPLLECGLTCIFPMEPAAGMDIVALRKQYGTRMAMAGGLDKHVLRQSRQDIRRELEHKMQPLMRDGGGIVFALDHRIPNGTPLANYCYYVDLGRELLGLPPRNKGNRSYHRMAF